MLDEVAGTPALPVGPCMEAEIADAMFELLGLDAQARRVRPDVLRHSVQRFTLNRFEGQWTRLLSELATSA